jgi:predicted Zn-ribbon and HTH transcriptional regulator
LVFGKGRIEKILHNQPVNPSACKGCGFLFGAVNHRF